MINQDKDMKISFKCSVAHQLLLRFTKSWTVFEQHYPNMIWMCSFIDSSFDHLSLPPANLNTFLLRFHCIAPKWSTFQGVSRNVDVIFVKDFANLIDIVLIWQSFLFWNQISYFKDHVYSSLIVEMKSERCQFKNIFEIQAFSIKDPTHAIQCSPLIVLHFENRNDPL
jgi:hypothetical protein